MTPHGELLLRALRKVQQPCEPGFVYGSAHEFVARHGREYPRIPYPGEGYRGIQRMCFGNAICAAVTKNLSYVEGFALAPDGSVILHAWNADACGKLYDSTWLNTGVAYFGVEFSIERADDATWNGDACILHDEHRGWTIFRTEWQGEDFKLRWPYSDRLDALRLGQIALATSVQNYLRERNP